MNLKIRYLLSTVILFCITLNSCDKQISSTQPTEVYNGKIIIDSNPQGAIIFVDGSNTTLVTPDSILHLAPVSYNVKLRYEPYLDTTFLVNVNNDEIQYVFFDFHQDSRNNGKIICQSDPANALIYINDSSTSVYTPHTFEMLPPGNYEVKYTFPEHRADSLSFRLSANETETAGLTLQDTTVWVDYHISNSGFPCKQTTCIIVDRNSTKWVGTSGSGIVKYDDQTFTTYNTANSDLPSNTFTCLYEDINGTIWAGSTVGLSSFDGAEWRSYTTLNSDIPYDYIETIAGDNLGNIYCAGISPYTENNSILKFDGTSWTSYEIGFGIINIVVNHSGQLWISSQIELFNFNPNLPINLSNPSYIDETFNGGIEELAVDVNNNLWIAVYPSNLPDRGVYFYDGVSIQKINTPSDFTVGISVSENNKWVSLSSAHPNVEYDFPNGGFIKLDNLNSVTYSTIDNSGLTCNTIIASAIQPNGDVWISTKHKGIIKFKGGDL